MGEPPSSTKEQVDKATKHLLEAEKQKPGAFHVVPHAEPETVSGPSLQQPPISHRLTPVVDSAKHSFQSGLKEAEKEVEEEKRKHGVEGAPNPVVRDYKLNEKQLDREETERLRRTLI